LLANDITRQPSVALHFRHVSQSPLAHASLSPTAFPTSAPRELADNTSFLLKKLGFAVKERSYEAYRVTGLTPQHHAVMLLLEEGTCGAQGVIADRLGYDRSQLVGLLDDLEERGYVVRKRDSDDRRRHLVNLTPEGNGALEELRAIAKAVETEFLAPLDAEDRAALHGLLLRLVAYHHAGFLSPES
jgi:MarR family transcriptional regulator, lower aerobic nicotinate degradation pathway regulator